MLAVEIAQTPLCLRVPRPTSLSIVISPSSKETIFRTIERPRPVPLDNEFSCANGMNNFERKKSAEMPFPVSVTVRTAEDLGTESPLPCVPVLGGKSSMSVASSLIQT
jgi:hypothetical protein